MSKQSNGWVNNVIQMWSKKDDKKKFFLSIPLAEPATLVLQRKTKDGFVNETVTLVPTENDKGYSSVILPMKKVEAYTHSGGTYNPPENLRQVASVPPGAQGDGESDF